MITKIRVAKVSSNSVGMQTNSRLLVSEKMLSLARQACAVQARQWLEENRAVICDYNMRIERRLEAVLTHARDGYKTRIVFPEI